MTREQGTLNWEQGRERRDFGQLYFSLLMLVFFRSPTYNLKKSPVCAKPKIINARTVNYNLSSLAGKTILVTRSVGQSNQFSDRLTSAGAKVIEMPTLEIRPPSSWEALDQAILYLSTFNWLILTSSNGVEYFFQRLEKSGQNQDALSGVKIAVVGEKTAESLQKQNIQADFIPPDFVADSLVENFPELLRGKKILFPRVESGGREVLVKELTAKGAEVIEVPAYESCCPQNMPTAAEYALVNNTIDIITFASSKTVLFFSQLTAPIFTYKPEILARVSIASIGPQTSKTCHSILGRVDIEAEEYTLEGLTNAIIKYVIKESRTAEAQRSQRDVFNH